MLLGSLWTRWIRDRLYMAQVEPPARNGTLGDQLVQWRPNLDTLAHPASSYFVLLVLVLGGTALSLFLFAGFAESRIWFEFIPFALLLWDAAPTPHTAPEELADRESAAVT